MKCPKCRYTSFPHLEHCPQCGFALAEQRAALGIYALRPNPPDLSQAYEAGGTEITGGRPTSSIYARGIDPGPLEGIDLEVAEPDPGEAEIDQMGVPTIAPDAIHGLGHRGVEGGEYTPEGPDSDRPSTQDTVIPEDLDLQQLGDMTLALESAEDLDAEPPPRAGAPGELADGKRVYDLDADEDLGGLTLGRIVEGVGEDDDESGPVEFTLEIEEDLEFEVDQLELEQDDEAEDKDDDER
jgi:hypothetical protein